ncbi:S-protein homolog 2-like [Hibiscus syriacus]|uniref:S-protein homolog 2-like n=1 Tax=Hibiscus syriacus TaxID=106335 RepID=UPI0019225D54|nr:S-protein homolog 2-like [Hibiscus syriacus]
MNPCAIRLAWLLFATLVLAASIEAVLVKVILYNDLEDKKELTIHCKSKDDDLGVHVLSYRESYGFRFQPNYFARTLFFCRVTSNGKSHWFDVFDGEREWTWGEGCLETDDKCVWNVRQNGPCTGTFNHCYGWNK